MRVRQLRIHNYCCIRHLELECGHHVVLLGPNNHGKSNIIGAVEFLMSPGAKPTAEDFFSFRDHKADPDFWVEAVFCDLSPQESTTFQRYVAPDDTVTIRKTASLNNGEVEVRYQGYVSEPDEWWLKGSEVDKLLKREDVELHAKNIPALQALLGQSGRITKQRVEDFQRDFIRANQQSLKLNATLESGPLLGTRNVAGGTLPDFYIVPAVKDLSDEVKVKATTMFGRLLQRAIQEMAEQNPVYAELRKKLADLVNTLNAREDNTVRPTQLGNIEVALDSELKDWGVKVQIEINAPEIEKILELGTDLQIDDGSMTSAERKGHGLQRAVLFAMLRAWAKVVRAASTGSTVPRKASQSLIFAIEEPELFLHPHAQRRLAAAINDLAAIAEHQIFVCTHSTHFVDMDDYQNIVIVDKPTPEEGTRVKVCQTDLFAGTDAKSRKDRFHMAAWINPDRSEMFFAKRVALTEGETEKTLFPFIANKLGCFDSEVSVVDCGSKHNLPLYIAVLNAFGVPYVVVHDEDPVPNPVPVGWSEEKRREKQRTFDLNAELAASVNAAFGRLVVIQPAFEQAAGISISQAEKRGKALAALDHFAGIDVKDIPVQIKEAVEAIYSPATVQATVVAAANTSN